MKTLQHVLESFFRENEEKRNKLSIVSYCYGKRKALFEYCQHALIKCHTIKALLFLNCIIAKFLPFFHKNQLKTC